MSVAWRQLAGCVVDWLARLVPFLFARRLARQAAARMEQMPKPRRKRRRKLADSSLIVPPPRKRRQKTPLLPEAAARAEAAKTARQAAAEAARREGEWGEAQAAAFLQDTLHWKILGRNVRYGPRLELDIVARQPDPAVLVFVEVKASRDETFGRPYARIDAAKRRAQSRAALKYLRSLHAPVPAFRFDVVEVVGEPEAPNPPVIRHIANAFPMDFKAPRRR